MNTKDIDVDVLAYLDTVAQIVASLNEKELEAQKIGEDLSEPKQALLELGRAYMFLYTRLLDTLEEEPIPS